MNVEALDNVIEDEPHFFMEIVDNNLHALTMITKHFMTKRSIVSNDGLSGGGLVVRGVSAVGEKRETVVKPSIGCIWRNQKWFLDLGEYKDSHNKLRLPAWKRRSQELIGRSSRIQDGGEGVQRSHSRQDKEQAQDLKSMITTSNHKLMIEVKDYELKTKVEA
ncbi:hypothetical protein Tco_0942406 [Tanacetum coccineum]